MRIHLDPIDVLVNYVYETQFDDITERVVEVTKDFIVDTIGVLYAGSNASGIEALISCLGRWGGSPQSSVYGGYKLKLPMPMAAMANSAMIHARDYDDVHDPSGTHANVTILPVALALAEREPQITGRLFVTAMAIGIDIVCRMGMAFKHRFTGWHASSVFGGFGAVACIAKLRGFSREQILNSFGIMYSMVSGNRQSIADGALTKRLQPGFIVRNAFMASDLAEKGVTGCREVIVGRYGLANLYFNGDYDEEILFKDLGRRFEGANLSYKLYSCCRSCHASIDATLDLKAEFGIEEADVEKVDVYVSRRTVSQVGRTFKLRSNPQVDAQFSIPYTVASAIVYGRVGLEEFEEKSISNEMVLKLAGKVSVFEDPDILDHSKSTPQKVVITLSNGKVVVKQVELRRGNPLRPPARAELEEKFFSCMERSLVSVENSRLTAFLTGAAEIEKLDVAFHAFKSLLD